MRDRAEDRGGWVLALGALGVVYGDIGTSPLYALRAALGTANELDRATVYGLVSLLIWSLVVVVTVLYVGLLLEVDNEGEGGLLALVALLRRTAGAHRAAAWTMVGMIGAATFLGDSVITPAISVLSAAEGVGVASPSLRSYAVPAAVVVLVGVFALQRVGSGRIGWVYGPVMLLWFLMIAGAGGASLARHPEALQAISPHWAVRYVVNDPLDAFFALGAVVLAVTGAEALFADRGHFGKRAIRRSWFLLVFPALLVAYLGEAAAVDAGPGAAGDPFWAVFPHWATVPVLAVATLATVIASEAVVAGAFTVLHQAGGLGMFPDLRVRHPSAEHPGQIYVPAANWALAGGVLLAVVAFRSSERLAAAYGLAVTATILVTVTLYLGLATARGWRLRRIAAAAMLVTIAVFLVATLPKFASGGWLPTGIAAVVLTVMSTWWSGRRALMARRSADEPPTDRLVASVEAAGVPLHRIHGTGVFLTEDAEVAPFALRFLLDRERVLHEHTVLLSWRVEDTPRTQPHRTVVRVEKLGAPLDGLVAVDVTLGYRERLDVEHVMALAAERDGEALAGVDAANATYFVSDPIPRLGRSRGIARWRQRLFVLLDRLATDRVEQLELPRHRTIIAGQEFEL